MSSPRRTSSRITVPPSTLVRSSAPSRSARPAFLVALAAAGVLTAMGQRVARERLELAVREAPRSLVAVRGDLVLRTRDVPIPTGVLDGRACEGARTRWVFPRATREALAMSLREPLGDTARADAVAAQARCDDAGCVVEPEASLVLSLPSAARAWLQTAVGHDASNPPHFAPRRRLAWDLPFAASPGLPPSARESVRRLSWDDQGNHVFADLAVACAQAHTAAERRALERAIHWPRTWEVALRTEPVSVERLLATFPQAARGALRASLEGARAAGRASVSIDPHLPANLRAVVGAWPGASHTADRALAWILQVTRGGALVTARASEGELMRDHRRVDDAPRFGDVLVMRGGDNGVMNAAVHLVAGMALAMPDVGASRPGRVAPLEELTLGMGDLWRVETWRREAPAPAP